MINNADESLEPYKHSSNHRSKHNVSCLYSIDPSPSLKNGAAIDS